MKAPLIFIFSALLVTPFTAFAATSLNITPPSWRNLLPGGTATLTVTQDESVVGTEYKEYIVTEADGDVCKASVLGSFGGTQGGGASNTKTYPNDFEIQTIASDGVCDTIDVGTYSVHILVEDFTCTLPEGCPVAREGEPGITFEMHELNGAFTVAFVVVPEAPIGSIVLIIASFAALVTYISIRTRK